MYCSHSMTASFILSVFIHSKKSGISPHFSTIITTYLRRRTHDLTHKSIFWNCNRQYWLSIYKWLYVSCYFTEGQAGAESIDCSFATPKKESIHDVAITNPIELGAAISDKDFILDIRVNLNNEQLIDLEMQMSNEYNWSERSISYAARSFDQLNSGEEYKEVLPVHSIGFLNFTLFEDQPEFFATYELRNKKQGIFTVVNFPSMC